MNNNFLNEFLNNFKKNICYLDLDKINRFVDLISDCKKRKGRIFFLGVGGSSANCSHAVNDFRKLCNIECYTPTDNISELTARINDDGWNNSFKDWLKISKISKNDLIFVFSVGGGNIKEKVSINIVNAIKYSKSKKCKILGITGIKNGYTQKNANVCLILPKSQKKFITPFAESLQSVIWHLIVSHPKLRENKTKW